MTKREIKYHLYRNPRLAFRLIQPKASFIVGLYYHTQQVSKRASIQRNKDFRELLGRELDLILSGDSIGKSKKILKAYEDGFVSNPISINEGIQALALKYFGDKDKALF